MRLLELFCGTKSVGKIFSKYGWEVISLDIDESFNPTITADICKWDYTEFPPNYFDAIWASPDCSTFSIASSGKYRTKAEPFGKENGEFYGKALQGNMMVDKTIEIIEYFKPANWFIENPKGLMRHYPPLKRYVKDYHSLMVYYANYGWGFPKPTDIWSKNYLWENESRPEMPESTYRYWTNKAGVKKRYYYDYAFKPARERSVVPEPLIERIYHQLK